MEFKQVISDSLIRVQTSSVVLLGSLGAVDCGRMLFPRHDTAVTILKLEQF